MLIKQRLQLVIQSSVNSVKLYLTVTVKLRKLRTLKVMNNKSGNVNSVTLKTMSILTRKKNQKLKLPTISLRLPHKFKTKKLEGSKEISVVFCIDQSGSMCVSSPIQGKVNIKGDKKNDLKEFTKFGDGSDQFLQGERNVTYISRMQCL